MPLGSQLWGAGTLGVLQWTLLGHCRSKTEEGLFNVRGLLLPGLDWSLKIPEAAFQPPLLISQPGLTGGSPGSCPLHIPETLAVAKLRKAAPTDNPTIRSQIPPSGEVRGVYQAAVRSGPRPFCFRSPGAWPTHAP